MLITTNETNGNNYEKIEGEIEEYIVKKNECF